MARDDMHYPPVAGAGPDVPLLPGSSPLELRNRPRRDTAWLIAFLVVLGSALGGGIFAFVHRNKNYQQFSPESFTDPKLCPVGSSHATRRLLQLGDEEPSPFDFELFLRGAGAWLAASIGGKGLTAVAMTPGPNGTFSARSHQLTPCQPSQHKIPKLCDL